MFSLSPDIKTGGIVRVWRCFLMCLLLSPLAAFADIPTVGYLTNFYTNICKNPNLGLVDNGMPNAIPSMRYTLGVIDWINGNSTAYANDVVVDAIASVEYLSDSMGLLTHYDKCCPGGYVDNDVGCTACGEWRTESTIQCLDEGEYLNGNTCAPCPDGYVCPAGTNGRLSTATIQVQCLNVNEYRINNQCAECGDGYRCPAGKNKRTDCGTGFWCADGVASECEWGENQCPLLNHTTGTEPVACDNALTFTN